MIPVASAVKADLVNAGLLGALGDGPANDRGRRLVPAVRELLPDLGIERTRRGEGRAGGVVDHLSINMLRASKDGQARPFERPLETLPDALLAPRPSFGNQGPLTH